jgi:hypothetical protein
MLRYFASREKDPLYLLKRMLEGPRATFDTKGKRKSPLPCQELKYGPSVFQNRLCVLVVRVPGYRSRGPVFDSQCYHTFWEVVGLERGPLGLMRITEEILHWKSSGSGSRKSRLTAVGNRYADHLLSAKVNSNFADKRRALGPCSSLADWSHGV